METEYAREMKTGAPGTKATLVLGGTGQTGRRVAEELAGRGLPIRVGSRSAPARCHPTGVTKPR